MSESDFRGRVRSHTNTREQTIFFVFRIDCRVIYTRKNDVSLLDQAGTVSLPIVFLGKGSVTFLYLLFGFITLIYC